MSGTRGFSRGERKGGAAVEFAVVFPILVLLVIGVVDYGRVFYTSVTVANAARAGAEYGASNPPSSASDTVGMRVYAEADGIDAGTLVIAAQRYCECSGTANACVICSGGAAPEVYVEVTASKTVAMLIPYPGLPSTFSVSRKATFRSQ
jgi:Flp pilus assembly protein TadG